MSNRDTAAIRTYHEATKHSVESVRSGPHFLDWDNMPRPFKVYVDLEAIPLPREIQVSNRPVFDAIAGPTRVGSPPDGGAPLSGDPMPATAVVDRALLARLLHFTAGVLRRRAYPGGGETFFRAPACTGNLHHIDLYLLTAALPDLEAGVYHFSPHDFALRRLRAGDHRALVEEATAGDPRVATAPAVIAFASTFWRNAWKYRARAYRHCFWDSGTMLANLLAVASAANLSPRVALGFVDETLDALLALDREREATLGLVAVGSGATAPPPAPALEPLALRTLPLSAHEVDYPAIRAAHAAGMLSSADEVAAWRAAALAVGEAHRIASERESARGDAATEQVPLTPIPASELPREPVEAVILRRGSTREFAHASIGLGALSTILVAVSGEVEGDFVTPGNHLNDLYVIAHAVDGLAPGAYAFDRARGTLDLLRAGEFRRQAGSLGLGQELPADAAVNLYWLADLDPVLDRLGNRGYRAAQLDAAIGGGRAYLAAFALGIGATGLTFFDDDVTRFFSPHAAGKSVMFLMALGMPARRRLRL